jgi:hypothetical protein
MGRLRDLLAARKRLAVITSSEYLQWSRNRRFMPNPPADMYRAYMTDCGMTAGHEVHAKWSKKVNRLDYGSIDSPHGFSHAPAKKQREPSRKHEGKITVPKVNEQKPAPIKLEIMGLADRATSRYGLPAIQFELSGKGIHDLQNSKNQMRQKVNPFNFRTVSGTLAMGTKGERGQVISTAAHEVGHYIHGSLTPSQLNEHFGINYTHHADSRRRSGYGETEVFRMKKDAEKYMDETAALKIAETLPEIKALSPVEQRRGKWNKAFCLATYRHEVVGSRVGENEYDVHFGKRRF